MKVLGVRIDSLTYSQLQEQLEHLLGSSTPHHVVTANPEMLVAAYRNPVFKDVLNRADLVVADGIGIVYASKLSGEGPAIERVTGNDLLALLIDLANRHGKKVYFLGGAGDQAERAAQAVRDQHPRLQIRAGHGGPVSLRPAFTALRQGRQAQGIQGDWQMDLTSLDDMKTFAPDILVVALGHEKQEMWIRDHLDGLPSIRIAVGVGGALAFLAGDVLRAPKWMRNAGLEWLWRLGQEPRRFWRIITAVVVFPVLVLWDRMKSLP